MSIDRQSASNFESSTMRKRRFRRVSDMFKLSQTFTRRERKRKKKFRLRNTIGNGKREKRATKRRWKKIESKKVLCLKDLPFATDLTSSTMMMRRQRSRSDMPRVRLSSLVSVQKIKSQNKFRRHRFNFFSDTSKKFIFRRYDLRFSKKK